MTSRRSWGLWPSPGNGGVRRAPGTTWATRARIVLFDLSSPTQTALPHCACYFSSDLSDLALPQCLYNRRVPATGCPAWWPRSGMTNYWERRVTRWRGPTAACARREEHLQRQDQRTPGAATDAGHAPGTARHQTRLLPENSPPRAPPIVNLVTRDAKVSILIKVIKKRKRGATCSPAETADWTAYPEWQREVYDGG